MSKLLGPAMGYTDFLNHETEEEQKNMERSPRFPLSPSQSGKCTRALAYSTAEYLTEKKLGESEVLTPEKVRIFKQGWSVERDLKYEFTKCKDIFTRKYGGQKVDIFDLTATSDSSIEFSIEGEIDDCYYCEESKGCIDYKSKKDKFSRSHKTDWEETDEKLSRIAEKITSTLYWVDDLPKFLQDLNDPWFASNFIQLNCYCNSEYLLKKGIDHGSIIQYNKNDSRIREIRFRPSSVVYRDTRVKFQRALDAAVENDFKKAPQDFAPGSIICAWCPFKDKCWPGIDTKQAYFDTFPKKKWPKDTNRFKGGREVEEKMAKWIEGVGTGTKTAKLEEEITKILTGLKIRKIKLDNGEIYKVKSLKNPRPHFVLRRSKL